MRASYPLSTRIFSPIYIADRRDQRHLVWLIDFMLVTMRTCYRSTGISMGLEETSRQKFAKRAHKFTWLSSSFVFLHVHLPEDRSLLILFIENEIRLDIRLCILDVIAYLKDTWNTYEKRDGSPADFCRRPTTEKVPKNIFRYRRHYKRYVFSIWLFNIKRTCKTHNNYTRNTPDLRSLPSISADGRESSQHHSRMRYIPIYYKRYVFSILLSTKRIHETRKD